MEPKLAPAYNPRPVVPGKMERIPLSVMIQSPGPLAWQIPGLQGHHLVPCPGRGLY